MYVIFVIGWLCLVKFFIKKYRIYGNVILIKIEVNVRVFKVELYL